MCSGRKTRGNDIKKKKRSIFHPAFMSDFPVEAFCCCFSEEKAFVRAGVQMMFGFMNDIKPLHFRGTLREMGWMVEKWMGWGRGEAANKEKSCLSTCIPLEQHPLNRQGLSRYSLIHTYTYTHMYIQYIYTRANTHPLRERVNWRGLVLSLLKILWVRFSLSPRCTS